MPVFCIKANPRSRGATSTAKSAAVRLQGLSPLARGDRRLRAERDRAAGPIPARAGRPSFGAVFSIRCTAYPRSRGATRFDLEPAVELEGLSPLARGDPDHDDVVAGDRGPIPARAGRPERSPQSLMAWGAYPRSRGATCWWSRSGRRKAGLSPLARGDRLHWRAPVGRRGPIPARAGRPWRRWCRPRPVRAYPRSRGATARCCQRHGCRPGLSPLARGDPPEQHRDLCGAGPIPARAGRPLDGPAVSLAIGAAGLSPLARGDPRL